MAEQKDNKKQKVVKTIFGMGNPLLDISANAPQDLLDKYGLVMNNAILAEPKHLPLYKELIDNHEVEYVAGGATQNSMRVAQWMSESKESITSFVGCVGKDAYGKTLADCTAKDNVTTCYLEDDENPTGTCAALIKDKERSLCANLAAAEKYKPEHLASEAVQALIKDASVFYISGFFITVTPEGITTVAKHSAENGKTFSMNLSAPFICQFFAEPYSKIIPYMDIIFGNESEAEAWGQTQKYEDTTPEGVAKALQALPYHNKEGKRIVVITQGAGDTIVALDDKVLKFPVPALAPEDIVDSNGAGDAFVGGFLSQYLKGESLEACVTAGHYAASVILGVSGTVCNGKPDWKKPVAEK